MDLLDDSQSYSIDRIHLKIEYSAPRRRVCGLEGCNGERKPETCARD